MHASIATVHGGSEAISSCSRARATAGRTSAGLPASSNTVHRKHVLGQIDANEDNAHGLPLLK